MLWEAMNFSFNFVTCLCIVIRAAHYEQTHLAPTAEKNNNFTLSQIVICACAHVRILARLNPKEFKDPNVLTLHILYHRIINLWPWQQQQIVANQNSNPVNHTSRSLCSSGRNIREELSRGSFATTYYYNITYELDDWKPQTLSVKLKQSYLHHNLCSVACPLDPQDALHRINL